MSVNIQGLIGIAKLGARRNFEEHGYVVPTALLQSRSGEIIPVAFEVPRHKDRDAIAAAIRQQALEFDAVAAALILESWVLKIHKSEPMPDVPPSQSERREEIVSVTVHTREGFSQIWTAEIARAMNGKASLLPWVEMGKDFESRWNPFRAGA